MLYSRLWLLGSYIGANRGKKHKKKLNNHTTEKKHHTIKPKEKNHRKCKHKYEHMYT